MKKAFLLLFVLIAASVQLAFAQSRHVKGKVLDEKGLGLPGAGIAVKNTSTGTVSDPDGNFELDVPAPNSILVVQAVGYGTQEVPVADGPVTVKMKLSSKELEGTVVTALGIKREQRELGYSSTTVGNEDLTAGNNSSALSGLSGKVAGANITSSTGGPGGSTRIVLRGEKSILKNNNALIVIDGVIMNNYDRTSDNTGLAQVDFGNSANDIDPDEIESITVLEGAAAAALYGASGANGAIMITTKSGHYSNGDKNSKMDITYKATYTQSDVLKFPSYQTQFGQGSIPTGIIDDRQDNFSWGLPFDGKIKPWGQNINGMELVKPYSDVSNPMSQFYNHGKDLNNFVSIGGGTEVSKYFISMNALNSTGVTPNTFYNKYSIRFNGTTQLKNNFYTSVNVNYINSYSRAENGGQSSGGVLQSLLQIPTDIPVKQLSNLSNPFYAMDVIDSAGVHRFGYFGAYSKNPFWVAQNYDNRNKTDRILGDLKLGYKKGEFDISDRVGVDVTDDRSYYKTPVLNVIPFDQSGLFPGNSYVSAGGYTQANYTGFRFYNDVIATYTHRFNDKFGINVLAGSNATMQQDETLSASINPTTNGLVIPGFYNFSNNTGPIAASNPLNYVRRYSFYGQVKLNYKREIFLELTGRNEWSSTLANPYFYPGANASWVFSERMKGKIKDKILDYGKIRIGSAGVSNDAVAYANNGAGYTQGSINSAFGSIVPPFNAVPAYQIGSTFGPADLKPEITREYEFGTDLSFLKNRINLSFTYYDDRTSNLITAIPLPPNSGYAFQYDNVGTISNKGEEFRLDVVPVSTKSGFKWDLYGTYTHNVNEVVSLNGGVSQVTVGGFNGMAIVAAVGHPFGTFYANDIAYENGHAIVDKGTGLPTPTAKPVFLGSYQPKFQASWGSDFTYKGFKLHVLFVTKQGGEFYDNNKNLMDFVGSAPETATNSRNPYVWANSVNQTGPNTYVANTTKFQPYDYWVNEVGSNVLPAQNLVNASYVKLQEMALSYKIPQKYYNKSPFGSLEAGVFGNNLLLWTAKSNKYDDPEETSSGAIGNGQGFNYNARPTLRNYGVSLKATF